MDNARSASSGKSAISTASRPVSSSDPCTRRANSIDTALPIPVHYQYRITHMRADKARRRTISGEDHA